MHNFFLIHHSIGSRLDGARFARRVAFPFIRCRDSRCIRCLMHSLSSAPLAQDRALPSRLNSWIAVSCHAPRVKAGRGMKVSPSLSHLGPYFLHLRLNVVVKACLGSLGCPIFMKSSQINFDGSLSLALIYLKMICEKILTKKWVLGTPRGHFMFLGGEWPPLGDHDFFQNNIWQYGCCWNHLYELITFMYNTCMFFRQNGVLRQFSQFWVLGKD